MRMTSNRLSTAVATAGRTVAYTGGALSALKVVQIAAGKTLTAGLPEDAHEIISRAPRTGLRCLGK